jgi:decaprenylphospho-beta-D-ribofuranose 2-oxidase
MNEHVNWPLDHLARLENFGHSLGAPAYLFRPTHIEQVAGLFAKARQRGTSLTFRGAGRSYGDAALNSGGVVVDLQRMNRVLEWDPDSGRITVEPGVTIEQLWKYTLEDGWWPAVVPGTMFPTLGGCLGANIHGKNNWQVGTIGEQVCAYSGMLGMITRVTLQMKKIYSGELDVRAWAEPGLDSMLAATERGKDENDYIVGWIDTTRGGASLGRGQMHSANYLPEGTDAHARQTLQVDYQVLPDMMFGVLPKSLIHKILDLGMHNLGAWAVNTAKYLMSSTLSHDKHYRQSHVAFNFLLDYVPNWERSYGKGGLIQYQSFIPSETARDAFAELLKRSQNQNLPSYLGVLKRHRPDKFLLSHALDGFSLALDFRVTRRNRDRLQKLVSEMDEIVLEAGGRFYFAKDSTLDAGRVRQFLGEEPVQRFMDLKGELDPGGLLESDLYRRCFQSFN